HRQGHPRDPVHRDPARGVLRRREHRRRRAVAPREPPTAGRTMTSVEPAVPRVRRSEFGHVLGATARTARGRTRLVLTGLVVRAAVVGPFVAPNAPTAYVTAPFAKPSAVAKLGGDVLGRDVLSRVLCGGWKLLLLAAAATVLGVALGAAAGIYAGYRRGTP